MKESAKADDQGPEQPSLASFDHGSIIGLRLLYIVDLASGYNHGK
jgi:hypothetical protein